jgi:hypothetical protein
MHIYPCRCDDRITDVSSYSINELYEFTPDVPIRGQRANPLPMPGALNEAEFIDLRLSPQRSRAGMIFDVKWCDFEGSNTALVVLTSVGKITWVNGDNRQRPWYSTRGNWVPATSGWYPPTTAGSGQAWAKDLDEPDDALASMTLPTIHKLSEYVLGFDWLSASGLSAQIYLGHIDGLDGAAPDMSELSDAEIIAGYPQWSSVMKVREHYVYPE